MSYKLVKSLSLSSAAVAIISGTISSPVAAQEQNSGKKVLEEVIVSAQRREESAQDVAISVTVFNQEQIANANMINSSDIATYTPSLSTNTRFGNENTSFSIRGFTQDLRTAASVGTYFAEVIAPRGQTSQTSGDGAGPGTLFDLANIQVLKGPQGTLFGRNTTGGSILLVPNKPSDEWEGYLETSTGDFGSRRLQGVLNIPFTDKFRLRLGVDSNEREGHLINVTNIGASELGNTDYVAFRLGLLWEITENIESYLLLTSTDSESTGYSSRLYACNNSGVDPLNPLANPFATFTNSGCNAQLDRQAASGQDGFYDMVSTVPTPITTIKEERLISTTSWNVSENITLKGILAYAHLEGQNGSDIFGTQFNETGGGAREFVVGVSVLLPDVPVTSSSNYVGEIQAQGQAFADKLIWQAGLYYELSEPDGFSGNNSASLINCDLSTLEGAPSEYRCNDPLNGLLGGVLVQHYKTEFENKAVYVQGTYDITESLSSTVGLRYTEDRTTGFGRKDRYNFLLTVMQDPITSFSSPEVSSKVPTGVFELNYRPIEDLMLYGKYTRGYRQGSVNLAADPGLDEHEYETVDTKEFGFKSEFGGPIPGRINAAYFTNTLTDMQLQFGYVSATSGPTTAITNAGEAEIDGYEIEAMFQLLEGLRLTLSYSSLDTELVEQGPVNSDTVRDAVTAAAINSGTNPATAAIQGELAGSTATPIALEGDTLPFAAENALVASLNYDLPFPLSAGLVTVGATYVHNGETRAAATGASPNGDEIMAAYNLLNVNASWSGIFGSNFDLSVFGTNIKDEEYVTYTSGTFNTLAIESRMGGMPKMYGARLRYSF